MAVPTFVSSGGLQTGIAGSGNVAWGTGHQTDDIGLLVAEDANEAMTFTTAAGFVEISGSPQGTGTAADVAATRLGIWWCRATSAAQTAPVIADPGDHVTARIYVFRGVVASGNPWDVDPALSADVEAVATTAVTIPGGTTVTQDCLILHFGTNGTDTATNQYSGVANASLSNFAEFGASQSGSGNGGGWLATRGGLLVPGAYAATTATLAVASTQGRISIALKSANPGVGNDAMSFCQGMGARQNRIYAPRTRGDLWVQPGDTRSTNPDLDTWEGEAT